MVDPTSGSSAPPPTQPPSYGDQPPSPDDVLAKFRQDLFTDIQNQNKGMSASTINSIIDNLLNNLGNQITGPNGLMEAFQTQWENTKDPDARKALLTNMQNQLKQVMEGAIEDLSKGDNPLIPKSEQIIDALKDDFLNALAGADPKKWPPSLGGSAIRAFLNFNPKNIGTDTTWNDLITPGSKPSPPPGPPTPTPPNPNDPYVQLENELISAIMASNPNMTREDAKNNVENYLQNLGTNVSKDLEAAEKDWEGYNKNPTDPICVQNLNNVLTKLNGDVNGLLQGMLTNMEKGPNPLIDPNKVNPDLLEKINKGLSIELFSSSSFPKEVFGVYAACTSLGHALKPGDTFPTQPHTGHAIQPKIPKTPPDGQTPFNFGVKPPADPNTTYVRVQGTDPSTGNPCYVVFDKDGNPRYVDIVTNPTTGSLSYMTVDPVTKAVIYEDFKEGDPVPAKYSTPVSQLKNAKLPSIISGRVYVSQGGPLQWSSPDRNNPSDPDSKMKYGMFELTNKGGEIWVNPSAVDGFQSPAIQIQQKTDDGKDKPVGYGGDPAVIFDKLYHNLQESDIPGIEPSWSGLFDSNTPSMTPPDKSPAFDHYYDNYLTESGGFFDSINKQPLWLQCTGPDGKTMESLKCTVSKDGKTFEFCDAKGNVVTTLPTNGDNSKVWFSGDVGSAASTSMQKDLMRDLSALLNSGMKMPVLTSQDHPIGKEYLTKARQAGLFYKAKDPSTGQPMWNVYDQEMHKAGYNGYAYAYDDMYGIDGTQHATPDEDPSYSIVINFGQ